MVVNPSADHCAAAGLAIGSGGRGAAGFLDLRHSLPCWLHPRSRSRVAHRNGDRLDDSRTT